MRSSTASRIAALITVLITCASHAGPFDPRDVAADAKFVIFSDSEVGRTTAIGKAFIDRLLADPGYAEFEKSLTEWAGFTPSQDVLDITVYGTTFAKDGEPVFIVHAAYDPANLRSVLVLLPDSASETYADHEILNWPDNHTHKRLFACLFDGRTIVLCNDAKNIAHAIDMLIDPSKSIESITEFPRPYKLNEKADAPRDDKASAADGFFFIGAVGLGTGPEFAKNTVLSRVNVASLKSCEVDGKTITYATATTTPVGAADRLFQFANGIKSIAGLAPAPRRGTTQPSNQAELVGELARTTVLSHDDAGVSGTLTLDNERAVALFNAAAVMDRPKNAANAPTTQP